MRTPERPGPRRARRLRAVVAAASFLTRLHVGRRTAAVTPDDLRAGAAWFPAVGAAIGLVVATTGWLASLRSPTLVAAFLAACVDAVVTGALHLDGLADTADGLGAAWSGRDGLRAMREPGIGAFGAVAVFLDLGLRVASMSALLDRPGFPWAIVAAASAARLTPLALARWLAYRRDDAGVGSWVRGGSSPSALAIGVGTAVVATLATSPSAAIAILVSAGAVTFTIGRLARLWFGGVTGDVFGASIELAQTLGLLAAVLIGAR